MDTTQPLQFSSVLSRIKAYQTKLAADSCSVEDPADKGTVGIPKDPENTDANQNMPASATNTESAEGKNLEDKQLKPVSTGKNVPTTSDGNKKEEVSSPTDPLSKIASRVSAVAALLKGANVKEIAPDVKDPTAKKSTPKPKADVVDVVDESAENKNLQTGKKEAANDAMAADLSAEALMKLASTIVATEGGMAAVEPILMKAAGIEAARQIMVQATQAHSAFVSEQAAYEEAYLENVKAAAEAKANEEAALDNIIKSASAADRDQIVKFASIHGEALSNITEPMLKAAYAAGAEDAAAMEDAGAAMPPEAAGAEGGEPPLPGAEGPASLEQIAQLLEAMVSAGEIDEETAIGVLQELAQGDAAAGGGDPAAEGGAPAEGAAPAEGEPPMPEEKMAFAKSSQLCAKLLKTINK